MNKDRIRWDLFFIIVVLLISLGCSTYYRAKTEDKLQSCNLELEIKERELQFRDYEILDCIVNGGCSDDLHYILNANKSDILYYDDAGWDINTYGGQK